MEPVAAQETFPFGRVPRIATLIRAQEITDEGEVVRKTIVGEQVESEVGALVDSARNHLVEVGFKLRAGEDGSDLAREGLELSRALAAEVPAGEFVMPRAILEAIHRRTVDALDALGHTVGFKESGEALIEAGVVGVARNLVEE